ncbi:MAG TPA: hypothetical protein VFL57_22575, partial [Bryobacteraceae bacterium]|nr:hypothetical protein [Bryobacteraceae bacterium]
MFLNRLFAAPRVLLAVSCLLAASVALGQGVDNPAVFELDGNTQVSSSKDWESTFAAGTPKTLIPIQDPAPNSIYTGGGSKDTNDVSQWKHKDGSVPDKDDIRQAAAVALPLPNGNLAIYFTATRFANNGDAQVGFWFFQKKVTPQPDGTFGPAPGQIANHENGDLLVLVNFEGGGLTPSIQVYQWQGGVNGGPVLVSAGLKVGQCGTGPNAGNHDVCAITNAGDSNAPASWGYEPKAGTAGVFPAQTFFEGAVNLSVIFGAGNVPCFSSFIAETRSSSSITAQLKDFAEG